MNLEYRGSLIGMILGDGHVRADHIGRNFSLMITHCLRQKDYLLWKADLIGKALRCKSPVVREFNNGGHPGVRMSKGHRYFRVLHNWMYRARKKVFRFAPMSRLDARGLAIWYMDDGSLSYKKRAGVIHSREMHFNTYLSLEENLSLVDYFRRAWGVEVIPVRNRNLYRLRLNTGEAKKVIRIIEPHIVPCMRYKIDMRYVGWGKKKWSLAG